MKYKLQSDNAISIEDIDSLIEWLHQARKDGLNFDDNLFELAEIIREEYET